MANILHQLEREEDDANLAFLRGEIARLRAEIERLQAYRDEAESQAAIASLAVERLRLTKEEREVMERALSLSGQGERRPEKVAVIRRLLGRFRP